MKSIILIRHGKSSWAYNVKDQERPLKARGVKDALLIAKELKSYKFKIDKVFSSPANRALSTSKIVVNELGKNIHDIKIVEDLYDFAGENVISFIRSLPKELDCILIFGHNNALTAISNIFGSIYIPNLPTSGLVKINFEVNNWSLLKNGDTERIITPKQLKND